MKAKTCHKLKCHRAIGIVFVVILALLVYQSFFVLPQMVGRVDEKAKLLGCSAGPVEMIVSAAKDGIAKLDAGMDEGQGIFRERLCLNQDDMIAKEALEAILPNAQFTFEGSAEGLQPELVTITSDALLAKKGVAFSGGVLCHKVGGSYSCSVIVYPALLL